MTATNRSEATLGSGHCLHYNSVFLDWFSRSTPAGQDALRMGPSTTRRRCAAPGRPFCGRLLLQTSAQHWQHHTPFLDSPNMLNLYQGWFFFRIRCSFIWIIRHYAYSPAGRIVPGYAFRPQANRKNCNAAMKRIFLEIQNF